MKLIKRYISITMLQTIALTLALLTGIFIFVLLVQELSDLGKGTYTIGQALIYVFLRVPQDVYQFFPMAALVGCLMGLGTLANHSELVVMRSSGVSTHQILMTILKTALVLALVVGVLGEVLAPPLFHYAQLRKVRSQMNDQSIKTAHGIWIREKNAFIRIDQATSHHKLQGVSIYSFDNHQILQRSRFAKTAVFANKQWTLYNVVESQFTKTGVTQHQYDQLVWPVNIQSGLLTSNDQLNNPENMTLWRLHWYIHYLTKNNLQDEKYALSFWRRILQPVAILIMMFLAVPFMFGPLRTVPMGYRIVAGIGVGFAFYFLNQLLGPMSVVFQLPAAISAGLPLLPFFVLGLWLMRRAK